MTWTNQFNNNTTNAYNNNNQVSKTVNDMFGLGKTGYSLYNTLGSSGTGGAGWFSVIPGLMRSTKTAINGGSFKDDVPQSFFGFNDSDDSEIMQGLKGTTNGALTGAAIGSVVPGIGTAIGAIIGGALGLGSSFLDDI